MLVNQKTGYGHARTEPRSDSIHQVTYGSYDNSLSIKARQNERYCLPLPDNVKT
jgi:hypothetical protein